MAMAMAVAVQAAIDRAIAIATKAVSNIIILQFTVDVLQFFAIVLHEEDVTAVVPATVIVMTTPAEEIEWEGGASSGGGGKGVIRDINRGYVEQIMCATNDVFFPL